MPFHFFNKEKAIIKKKKKCHYVTLTSYNLDAIQAIYFLNTNC